MNYPGGTIDGKIVYVAEYPVVSIGTTLALVLNYVNDDFASLPHLVAPVVEIPRWADLPSNADIDAAYSEICGRQ